MRCFPLALGVSLHAGLLGTRLVPLLFRLSRFALPLDFCVGPFTFPLGLGRFFLALCFLTETDLFCSSGLTLAFGFGASGLLCACGLRGVPFALRLRFRPEADLLGLCGVPLALGGFGLTAPLGAFLLALLSRSVGLAGLLDFPLAPCFLAGLFGALGVAGVLLYPLALRLGSFGLRAGLFCCALPTLLRLFLLDDLAEPELQFRVFGDAERFLEALQRFLGPALRDGVVAGGYELPDGGFPLFIARVDLFFFDRDLGFLEAGFGFFKNFAEILLVAVGGVFRAQRRGKKQENDKPED